MYDVDKYLYDQTYEEEISELLEQVNEEFRSREIEGSSDTHQRVFQLLTIHTVLDLFIYLFQEF